MSNRRWNLVAALLVIAVPAWSQTDRKVTPVLKATLLSVKSVTLNPTSVTGGATVNGVVTITAAVPGPVTVKIASSAPQFAEVPQSVVIPQGATTATFIVQTHPVWINPSVVTNPPSAKISAQLGNDAPLVAALTVLPPSLTSLALNPASVGGGSNATGTLTLSGPAPSAGINISLTTRSSSTQDPRSIARVVSGIGVPAQVAIPAGATSATFTVTTHPVAASTPYQISAAWGAFVTKTATLTVTTPDISTLKKISGGPFGGTPATLKVILTGPAPAEGMTINLKTSVASGGTTGTFAQCGQIPSVPATTTVPAGATSVDFTVTTYPGYGEYWVLASTPTKSADLGLGVSSPYFKPVVPSSTKGGTPIEGKIQLTSPAMPVNCNNRYVLQSSKTAYAQVPAYVDVAPGTNEATFSITTTAMPASSPPVTVTISASGRIVNNGMATPGQQTFSATLTITP